MIITPEIIEETAKKFYEEYCDAVGGRAHDGEPLPDWDMFFADPKKAKQSAAWLQVAKVACEAFNDGINKANEQKVLTCVFCGQEYPVGTKAHGEQILVDHIKVCEKHPLRAAEATIKKLQSVLMAYSHCTTKEELIGVRDYLMSQSDHEDKEVAIAGVNTLLETLG